MLSINISELVLTVLNFLLLYFLLNKLLFKPLIAFMDARKARIEAGIAKERAAEAEKHSNGENNLRLEEQRRLEAERLVAKMNARDERHRKLLMDKLHEEEEDGHRAIAEDLARLEEREHAELVEHEDELAKLLAERLLS